MTLAWAVLGRTKPPWNRGGTWVAGDLLITVHPASSPVSAWDPLALIPSLRIPSLSLWWPSHAYAKLASAKGEDSAPSL